MTKKEQAAITKNGAKKATKKKVATKKTARKKADPTKAKTKAKTTNKARKPAVLCLYKDIMNQARITCKEFIVVAKAGNRNGWREPGPAQWDLAATVNLKKRLSTLPEDEKIGTLVDQANTMFQALLIDGFRKGVGYRKTNRIALVNLRAFYTEHIKPELTRIKIEAKIKTKKEQLLAKAGLE